MKHLAENLLHSCRFLVSGGFPLSSYGEELTNEVKEVIEGVIVSERFKLHFIPGYHWRILSREVKCVEEN